MACRRALQGVVTIVMFCLVEFASHGEDLNTAIRSRYVDPFISTGGNRYVCGNNSPGAMVPFGLVRLSPDTYSLGGKSSPNTSGYYYHDPLILGFSHTRLCGTGAVDGGHFRVMPGTSNTPLEIRRHGMHTELAPGYSRK